MNFGPEHFRHMASRLKQAATRAAKWEAKGERAAHYGFTTAEVTGGAFLAGVVQGRAGDEGAHILHIPAEIVGGAALLAAGWTNFFGKYSDHVANVGIGALAAFAAGKGFGVGKHWHDTGSLFGGGAPASLPAGTVVKGELDPMMAAQIAARYPAGHPAQHGG